MADFDMIGKITNNDKNKKRIKHESDEDDIYCEKFGISISESVRNDINQVETPPVPEKKKKLLYAKTASTRNVQRQQHHPLSHARTYHQGGSMETKKSKKRQRNDDEKKTTSLENELRRRHPPEKSKISITSHNDSSLNSTDENGAQAYLKMHEEMTSSAAESSKKSNKFSPSIIDVDSKNDHESIEEIKNSNIPKKDNCRKSFDSSEVGLQNLAYGSRREDEYRKKDESKNNRLEDLYSNKHKSTGFNFKKVNGGGHKAPKLKGSPIIPGESLKSCFFDNDSFNDEIISSSQEDNGRFGDHSRKKKFTVCHLHGDNDEEYTPLKSKSVKNKINTPKNRSNHGGVLAGVAAAIGNFATDAIRSSSRKKKKKEHDVIHISSDEESVFEETSPRCPSPTIARLPPIDSHSIDVPRTFGERQVLSPIRISFEDKVFSHSCSISFQTGTNDPHILISYVNKDDDRKLHKIYVENNSLIEMRYFVEDDDDEDVSIISNNDPINILVLLVEASVENELLEYCTETPSQQAEEDDSNPPRRRRVNSIANNPCHIVAELRDPSEFKEKVEEIMNKNDILREMLEDEKSKLTKTDSKLYTKPIIEDMELDNIRKMELEDTFSARRVTRSSRKASKNKLKNGGTDVVLIFPFKIQDERELSKADYGLDQLTIEGNHDVMNIDSSPSDIDSKTQYAHYLTIHESDCGRLEQGEFLNDTLIDFWMSWMWRKENHATSKVHFFSSHFFSTLQEKGPSGVSRWTSKKNIDIFKKTFIFIPINESLHWSLCVVCNPGKIMNAAKYYDSNDIQKKALEETLMPCILFMDSLKAHRKLKVANIIREWLNSMWEEIHRKSLNYHIFDKGTMPIIDPIVPYQSNSWDCGVFVCRYAQALYQQRDTPITFAHKEHRLKSIITDSKYFDFGMSDISQFRDQLATLIENLSRIYSTYNKKSSSNKNKC